MNNSQAEAVPLLDSNLRAGLALLQQAYSYAEDSGVDSWEFALEIDQLYGKGLSISDLRWLVAKGYAEHGQESSFYGDAHRSFRRSEGLNFAPTTCFVLGMEGAEFAAKVLKASADTR